MSRTASRIAPLGWILVASLFVSAQVEQTTNIIGRLRVVKGDFPSHRVMIELRFRGSPVNTTYADNDGKFGFLNLVGGEYHVVINDEDYSPVDERILIHPENGPTAMLFIALERRESSPPRDPASAKVAGTNRNEIDVSNYNRQFSKKALKEYGKGLDSDRQGNRDEAILHYEAALKLAPDYYPAHNNLGSDYLSKSDFSAAREQFEEVIRLNQSDAAAYFNLSNVSLLTGKLDEAQRYLDEGLRREPDSALGQYLLGSLDMKTGKFDQGEIALRQASQLNPTMAQARLQLINLLLARGRTSDATDRLRDFIRAFPDSPFTPHAKQLLQRLEISANAGAR